MSEDPDVPTFSDVLELAVAAALARARVMLPGKIVAYDSVRQSVDVQPLVPDIITDELDQRQVRPLPVLTDVPVQFYGSGDTRYTLPLKKGDLVELVFASSSIAQVKLTGKLGDPKDSRHHSHSDAVAHPGFHSFNAVPTSAPTDVGCLHGPHHIGGPNLTINNQAVTHATLIKFMEVLAATTDPVGACALLAANLAAAFWPLNFLAEDVRLK